MSDRTLRVHVEPCDPECHGRRDATLVDVVGVLAGMLQCGTCNGTGEIDRESEMSVVGCPDCVDGYQIPGLVVAARESGHGWTTDMRDLSRFVVAWLEQMKGEQ